MPHISAYQCPSVPPISARQCCLKVPNSAVQQLQSVPSISASQCRLSVRISATYQCHISVLPFSAHQ
ncbi:unnamed protein product [Staurois parvus]|uniref:Uncharacterized protein n=1 Tax=Staurois parvus TaxID=386267 RepID=A0ABN9FW41_9NEOB|nr:unnamed protein product [Staurois parvus]